MGGGGGGDSGSSGDILGVGVDNNDDGYGSNNNSDGGYCGGDSSNECEWGAQWLSHIGARRCLCKHNYVFNHN